ncbi:hypothetical protein [Olivibacter sp. XZL3]|nr:hypothetical protein [Olivibacter sp. XZL3]
MTAESSPTQDGLGIDRDCVAFGFAYGHRSPSDPQASQTRGGGGWNGAE